MYLSQLPLPVLAGQVCTCTWMFLILISRRIKMFHILYVPQTVSPSFQFSLCLPESTWPMTTMLMWVFSLPMLRWYRCWNGSWHLEVKLETWEIESEPRPAGVLPQQPWGYRASDWSIQTIKSSHWLSLISKVSCRIRPAMAEVRRIRRGRKPGLALK